MKNIFKKMIVILGIIGVSATSFAVPAKKPQPKPKPRTTVEQPKKKTVKKKPAPKKATSSQNKKTPNVKKPRR